MDLAQRHDLLAYPGHAVGLPLHSCSWLIGPLLIQGQVQGLILLAHSIPNYYRPSDITRIELFTSLIAIALHHASLQHAAEQAAVLKERARLARELHDAVTQTLFSASLIAEALPDVLQRSPEQAVTGVQELRRLTSRALAELRTLVVELRPKALTEKPLGQLLQLLCTSHSSHITMPFRLEVRHDATLEPAVQLAFYRVAQEALNNVVKHAQAQGVEVVLDCTVAAATLWVRDDGQGFDPTRVRPDSLGLGLMHERAAEIGAALTIASEPGGGTTVLLRWQEGAAALQLREPA